MERTVSNKILKKFYKKAKSGRLNVLPEDEKLRAWIATAIFDSYVPKLLRSTDSNDSLVTFAKYLREHPFAIRQQNCNSKRNPQGKAILNASAIKKVLEKLIKAPGQDTEHSKIFELRNSLALHSIIVLLVREVDIQAFDLEHLHYLGLRGTDTIHKTVCWARKQGYDDITECILHGSNSISETTGASATLLTMTWHDLLAAQYPVPLCLFQALKSNLYVRKYADHIDWSKISSVGTSSAISSSSATEAANNIESCFVRSPCWCVNHNEHLCVRYRCSDIALEDIQEIIHLIFSGKLEKDALHSSPGKSLEDKYVIIALDCEMVQTDNGFELGRISVVDQHGKILLDKFVRPEGKVVDYLVRFSGLTEDILQRPTTVSFSDAQDCFLHLLNDNPDTILVGHSLENDLRALRVIHTRCADTSLLFPHSLGFPYRKSLRKLVNEYLKRDMLSRNGENAVEGHCSIDDAASALDLFNYKLFHGIDAGINDDVLRQQRSLTSLIGCFPSYVAKLAQKTAHIFASISQPTPVSCLSLKSELPQNTTQREDLIERIMGAQRQVFQVEATMNPELVIGIAFAATLEFVSPAPHRGNDDADTWKDIEALIVSLKNSMPPGTAIVTVTQGRSQITESDSAHWGKLFLSAGRAI